MGPGHYPKYTRAPKVGGGCGWLAKHYTTYMRPNHEGNGRSIHNKVAEPDTFHSQEPAQVSTV